MLFVAYHVLSETDFYVRIRFAVDVCRMKVNGLKVSSIQAFKHSNGMQVTTGHSFTMHHSTAWGRGGQTMGIRKIQKSSGNLVRLKLFCRNINIT
jgi:hypothetical protein